MIRTPGRIEAPRDFHKVGHAIAILILQRRRLAECIRCGQGGRDHARAGADIIFHRRGRKNPRRSPGRPRGKSRRRTAPVMDGAAGAHAAEINLHGSGIGAGVRRDRGMVDGGSKRGGEMKQGKLRVPLIDRGAARRRAHSAQQLSGRGTDPLADTAVAGTLCGNTDRAAPHAHSGGPVRSPVGAQHGHIFRVERGSRQQLHIGASR